MKDAKTGQKARELAGRTLQAMGAIPFRKRGRIYAEDFSGNLLLIGDPSLTVEGLKTMMGSLVNQSPDKEQSAPKRARKKSA